MNFRKISEIIVEDREVWGVNNIFITFDIDWAHDDVLLLNRKLRAKEVEHSGQVRLPNTLIESIRKRPL